MSIPDPKWLSQKQRREKILKITRHFHIRVANVSYLEPLQKFSFLRWISIFQWILDSRFGGLGLVGVEFLKIVRVDSSVLTWWVF